MTKSNLTIRSNVFVRTGVALEHDRAFVAQIRGGKAIGKILAILKPDQDKESAARQLLTPRQISEVAWQVRCVCGAYPEGPVSKATGVEVQFRCPQKSCISSNFRARRILLDPSLVDALTKRFEKTISEIVADALKLGEVAIQEETSGRKFPFSVRLTLSQYTMFTDARIEAALLVMLGKLS